MLTTDFLPELKLRVSGAIPLLPLYAFTASSGMSPFTCSYCLLGCDIVLSGRNLCSFQEETTASIFRVFDSGGGAGIFVRDHTASCSALLP